MNLHLALVAFLILANAGCLGNEVQKGPGLTIPIPLLGERAHYSGPGLMILGSSQSEETNFYEVQRVTEVRNEFGATEVARAVRTRAFLPNETDSSTISISSSRGVPVKISHVADERGIAMYPAAYHGRSPFEVHPFFAPLVPMFFAGEHVPATGRILNLGGYDSVASSPSASAIHINLKTPAADFEFQYEFDGSVFPVRIDVLFTVEGEGSGSWAFKRTSLQGGSAESFEDSPPPETIYVEKSSWFSVPPGGGSLVAYSPERAFADVEATFSDWSAGQEAALQTLTYRLDFNAAFRDVWTFSWIRGDGATASVEVARTRLPFATPTVGPWMMGQAESAPDLAYWDVPKMTWAAIEKQFLTFHPGRQLSAVHLAFISDVEPESLLVTVHGLDSCVPGRTTVESLAIFNLATGAATATSRADLPLLCVPIV